MASQTITGPDLQYTQDNKHCFAFSGPFEGANAEQTVLEFTTGSGFIVATLTMTAPVRLTAASAGYYRVYELTFNGDIVGLYKVEAATEPTANNSEVQILIPPFTTVVLTCQDNDNASTYHGTANLTGRVYEYLPVRN